MLDVSNYLNSALYDKIIEFKRLNFKCAWNGFVTASAMLC